MPAKSPPAVLKPMPFTFPLSAIPTNTHEGEYTDGVGDGLRFLEIEEPVHPSGHGRRGFHLGARAGGVGLEVLVEEAGEFFRGGVVGGFVGPGVRAGRGFPTARRGHR